MTLPEIFFNPKQARETANHSSKKKTGIKRKGEKNSKVEKPINFDFCACLGRNVLNAILVTRTASCRVTNAFSTRLKLIWPRSSFKSIKMSKKPILAKSSRCQWVKMQRCRGVTRDRDKKSTQWSELCLEIKRYTSTSPLHVPDRENRERWKL